MEVRILKEGAIRGLIGPAEALHAVRDAFAKLARGEATLPEAIGFDVATSAGEVHVKGAYLHGSPFFSFKEASGFYRNPATGLPVGGGVVLVFDASTGFLRVLLFDNGFLTDLRTAAAGALTVDLLAKKGTRRVGILGCGVQARYELEAVFGVRQVERVLVHGRSPGRAAAFATEAEARFGVPIRVVSAQQAVEESDVVITTTPARQPIVRAAWVHPGTHITAVGSDGPGKQELDVDVLGKATKIVVDRLAQCLRSGELHHAVETGTVSAAQVHAELGELVVGAKPSRTADDEITVADLTGVGIQDAAVAAIVASKALDTGAGESIHI